MNHYHIRFNTKHGGSPLVWRVFENGTPFLVKNFFIKTPMWGEQTEENGEIKWNVACKGVMRIVHDIAYIESE
jgi:hypothetical protein